MATIFSGAGHNGFLGDESTRVVVLIPTVHGECMGLRRWLYGPNGQSLLRPKVITSTVTHRSAGFVEDVRQYIVELFLTRSAAPWLLMIDDDTFPTLSALAIAKGAEEAGILLTASPVPFHPFILDEDSPRGVHANLFKVDATGFGTAYRWHDIPWPERGGARFWPIKSAGFGCTLIHRTVLERLMDAAKKGKLEYPMRAMWRQGRLYRSEDIAFWMRAAKLGYRLYADLGNPCSHDKRLTLTPQMALDDIAFWEPGRTAHVNAPRQAPEPQPVSAVGEEDAARA